MGILIDSSVLINVESAGSTVSESIKGREEEAVFLSVVSARANCLRRRAKHHESDLGHHGKACDRPGLRCNDGNLPHRRHDGSNADLHGSHPCVAVPYCVCTRETLL